jgi:hypothetical protein
MVAEVGPAAHAKKWRWFQWYFMRMPGGSLFVFNKFITLGGVAFGCHLPPPATGCYHANS